MGVRLQCAVRLWTEEDNDMSSGGSREIEAAKRRVAAAKAQKRAADEMEKAAKAQKRTADEMEKAAKKNKAAAAKELKEAEKFLKETEGRLEVIDVDEEGNSESGDETHTSSSDDTSASDNQSVDEEGNNDEDTTQSGDESQSSSSDETSASDNLPSVIEMVGCGSPGVNGHYHLKVGNYYSKEGEWKGKPVRFVLLLNEGYWRIRVWELPNAPIYRASLYRTMNRHLAQDGPFPPRSGWVSVDSGDYPAPKLQW